MEATLKLCLTLSLGLTLKFGVAQDLEYQQQENERVPQFITHNETLRVQEGDTVLLPCSVDKLGNYILVWKKESETITASNLVIIRDSRFKLVDGYNLQLKHVKPSDAGRYVCEVSKLGNPLQLVHRLEISVPPTVRSIPADGNLVIRKGKTVTLTCEATGNPPPTITWIRKNNLLPSGETSVEGFSITIDQADRYQAGLYQCTADNGVGTPVTAEINLQVLYAPEVEVERDWIHTGAGYEAELVCIVHAEPTPVVKWYRETLLLDRTERRLVQSRGNRHTLILRDVQRSEFGNYSCLAHNTLGKARKYITVSGQPHPAVFRSAAIGYHSNSYNITWSVESYSEVEEFRLLYRRYNSNGTHEGHNDWNNVIIPANKSNYSTHFMSYIIKGLQPSAIYEAVVQAKNKYGWNQTSEPFRFNTRSLDYPPYEPSPVPEMISEPEVQDLGMRSATASFSSCLQSMSLTVLIYSVHCIS